MTDDKKPTRRARARRALASAFTNPDFISTLMELVGLLLLSLAGALVAPALGFAVLGAGLIAVGVALGMPAPQANREETRP